MYRKFLLPKLVLFSFIFSLSLLAQDSPWTSKAEIPTPRWFLSSCAANGKIYAIGGMGSGALVSLQKVEEYDPATDTWDTTKADMPTARGYLATAKVNGKIYAFGGDLSNPHLWNYSADTEEYDPMTNTWDTTKADVPTARTGLCAGVVDGKIYVIGGQPPVSKNEMYDPATDTWTPKLDMPTPRRSPTCGVVDGKIYTFGGIPVNGGPCTDVVEMYDPATDTWTTKAPMPGPRYAHSTAVVNGKIYIFGGISKGGNFAHSNLWVYDPQTDTWRTLLDMPLRWTAMGYSVVNERVYLMAGSSEGNFPYWNNNFKRVEAYYPHNDLYLLIENVNVDRSYAIPGSDNVLITSKINNPSGITLFAKIEADQTPFDSVQLFDDGNHNDGNAGDSLFANSWLVPPNEENNYSIDLQVTRVDTDTVVNQFNNMAVFTTIGPVAVEDYSITSSDTIVNPGDSLKFQFVLKNKGSVVTAKYVTAKIFALDTFATVIGDLQPWYGNIAPGETVPTNTMHDIKFSDICPVNSYQLFKMDIYSNGIFFWHDTLAVLVNPPTSIDEQQIVPNRFILEQNYPNPFNPSTTFEFSIPKTEFVTLKIYNLLGQEIATLVEKQLTAGSYSYFWDATGFASGVYYSKIEVENYTQTRKLILMK